MLREACGYLLYVIKYIIYYTLAVDKIQYQNTLRSHPQTL